jgi:excisionase family DNA binding protein
MGKMTQHSDRMLYSPTEVAIQINFGRTRVYELIKSGQIPSIQVDGRTRVRHKDLAAWIEARASQGQ